MPERMKLLRRQRRKKERIENPEILFSPESIEITVDGEGIVWFPSSAPIFEKEKGAKDILCG